MPSSMPRSPRPLAVWELTLRCDQRCLHCGSNAGVGLPDELSPAQVLDLADQLVELRCFKVTLMGGEAYLRTDLEALVERLSRGGVVASVLTGGRHLERERLQSLQAAGLREIGFSVEGPEGSPVHDQLRGNLGSLQAALRCMDTAAELGLAITTNTQLNALNHELLPEICATVRRHGTVAWHLQLTIPTGRARDRQDWMLQPYQIVPIVDTAAALQLDARARPLAHERRGTFDVLAGDDLGYFGPHEETLRSRPGHASMYWQGCPAGRGAFGIASNGVVRPCASMQFEGWDAGKGALRPLWESSEGPMAFRTREQARWGFCAECYYGEICEGGCSSIALAFFGRLGNYPFCYHRVTTLARRGLRERIVPNPDPAAPFRILEEPLPKG